MQQHHHDMTHFHEECTPGFLNNEGCFKDKPTFIGAGPLEYTRLTDAWRQRGFKQDTRRDRSSNDVPA